MPATAPELASAAPSEQIWRRLVALLDFGDRLDFALLEFSSPEILRAWSAALRARCKERGQPWNEARPEQSVLDWLDAERVRGLAVERDFGAKREREVYLGVIPEGNDERFVFARINENRDNLVRALNGVLCLAGPGDFIRRLAYAAPSIWAMRAETFELREPPPAEVAVPVPEAPASQLESAKPSFDLDVLISAGARDEKDARGLLQRLTGDGFSVAIAQDTKGHAQLERAKIVVVLLSYSYPYSEAWEALQKTPMAVHDPRRLNRRLIPLQLSEGAIPSLFRNMTPLDYRSFGARAKSYVKLVHALRGERLAGTGPGLEAYAPEHLSGVEKVALLDALLTAFSREALKQLLAFRLDKNLDHIASPGQPLRANMLQVIAIAEAEGWLGDLLRAALAEVPGNPRLRAFADKLGYHAV